MPPTSGVSPNQCHTGRLRRFGSYIARVWPMLEKDSQSRDYTIQDDWALQWTVKQLDKDQSLELLIQSLPEFIKSSKVRDGQERLRNLLEGGLGHRIVEIIRSCNSIAVLDASEATRAIACMHVICLLAPWFTGCQWSQQLMDSLSGLATSPSFVASWARCTTTILAHVSLSKILRGRWPTESWWRRATATTICSLASLPVIQPLRPLLQVLSEESRASDQELRRALEQLRPHLQEVHIVSLIQALSNYLRNPSEPSSLRMLCHILEHWTVDATSYQYNQLTQMLRPQFLLAELRSTSTYGAQHNPGFPNVVLDVAKSFSETLTLPIWQAVAGNILEGKDPNDSISFISDLHHVTSTLSS